MLLIALVLIFFHNQEYISCYHDDGNNLINNISSHLQNTTFIDYDNGNLFYTKFFVQLNNGNCAKENCKPPFGFCYKKQICKCLEHYAHVEALSNKALCSYKRKSQLYAFFIEMILSFGIGHMYCARIKSGCIKLLLETLMIGAYYLMRTLSIEFKFHKSPSTSLVLSLSLTFCSCAFLIFHCTDLVMFALNQYKDGYNVPLITWNIYKDVI